MMTTFGEGPSTLQSFGELSRDYADQGETRLAQLAAWACDVHLLEDLLWENGLGDAPDPDAQLAAVGDAVAASLEARAADVTEEMTARDVVEVARQALLSTFDESVHPLVLARLLSLDHLDDRFDRDPFDRDHLEDLLGGDLLVEAASGPAQHRDEPRRTAEESALERLEGRTNEQLVGELLATAADCMAVSQEMLEEGEVEGAARMARQADTASFEAYLTTAAASAGDLRLATVDLRWALARRLTLPGLASVADFHQTTTTGRAQLAALLGSAEQTVLNAGLELLPEV